MESLKLGLLTPLQKPGKQKGPPENLRPVILLSTLRKILAICLIERIQHKINTFLPISQTAYSHGRSGSELVFSFKILAEKAVTSQNYEINLLLLDMSKAFDTIKRETLFTDLQNYLNYDELQIVRVLLDQVKYSIKLENELGEAFTTNIGSPQGDGISALFFIIYLAISLKKYNENTNSASWSDDHGYAKSVQNTDQLLPTHLLDHNYYTFTNQQFTLDQQYADDIGWASTQNSIIDHIEQEIPTILEDRNLQINATKTERYAISRHSNDDWKQCKYIGSLLGTEEDIARRKKLANFAYQCLKSIFTNKHVTTDTKLRVFSALIESIFLYNSELWGTNKSIEKKIDTFQRNLLRLILQISWKKGNWLSNVDLYAKTKVQPWSKTIAKRRLRFFGHVARLDDKAPAKLALYEAIRKTKHPQGRQKTTLIGTIKKQLEQLGISDFHEAIFTAQDRNVWTNNVVSKS